VAAGIDEVAAEYGAEEVVILTITFEHEGVAARTS
jgi:hypothetical protein